MDIKDGDLMVSKTQVTRNPEISSNTVLKIIVSLILIGCIVNILQNNELNIDFFIALILTPILLYILIHLFKRGKEILR